MEKIWNSPDFFLGEEDYENRMKSEVEVFCREHMEKGDFQSFDGAKIHYDYVIHPQERAAIVISHGFCEFVGKYYEMIYYYYKCGYSVFFINHRGHGYSQRFVKEPDYVYVKDFNEYVEDLHIFMEQAAAEKSKTHKYLLYCHSMGGAIGGLFLEQYPQYFSSAVLSSPMLEMFFTRFDLVKAHLALAWAHMAGWMGRLIPGQNGFDGEYDFAGSCGDSEPRYAYVLQMRREVTEFQMSGGTFAWSGASLKAMKKARKNADKVLIPVLMFQAGKDDLVSPGGQEIFAKRSAHTKIEYFPESKHEIYNAIGEMRMKYYGKVLEFYEEQVK